MSKREDGRLERANSNVRMEIKLQRSFFLENLTSRFGGFVVDWERLKERLVDPNIFTSTSQLKGYIAEEALQMFLEEASAKFPNRIKMDPIENGTVTDHYKFVRNGHRLIVYRQRLALGVMEPVTDYDSLTLIDGIPVLWEVKLFHEKMSLGRGTMNKAISPVNIAIVTHPIKELFDKTPGFVMVVDKDMKTEMSPFQEKFHHEIGGYMVRFPVDRQTLKEKVQEFYESKH